MGLGGIVMLALSATAAPTAAGRCDGPFVLFFTSNSSTIVGEGHRVIDEAARCASSRMAIEGNIDAAERGRLGLARARAVRDALARRGIAARMLKLSDNGMRKPRVMAEAAEAQNRYALIQPLPLR